MEKRRNKIKRFRFISEEKEQSERKKLMKVLNC